MAIIDDQETLQLFIEDAREHLDGIENDLLAIETAGSDVSLVNKVFRAVHSIKGGAGFLGLETLKELAHSMENVLNMMRNSELAATPAIISTLLAAADVLTTMVHDPAHSDAIDIHEHVAALSALTGGPAPVAVAVPAPAVGENPEILQGPVELLRPDGSPLLTTSTEVLASARQGGKQIYVIECDLLALEAAGNPLAELFATCQETGTLVTAAVDFEAVGVLSTEHIPATFPCTLVFATVMGGDVLASLFAVKSQQVRRLSDYPMRAAGATSAPHEVAEPPATTLSSPSVEATSQPPAAVLAPPPGAIAPPANPPAPPASTPPASPPARSSEAAAKTNPAVAENSLRVRVKTLDRLMTLAGELVLTRNQLLQAVASRTSGAVEAITQRVDLITSELQEAIMSTRMQPIGTVFQKFQRVVRDLARDLGKEVDLVIKGEEVELDKTIVEAIGDPLTHLVRNAVDHGLERPEVRKAAKKSPRGSMRLVARHEAGQVIIEVAEDGAGIDPQRIKNKALSAGLMEQTQLDAMSERELVRLIFLPGFSTAAQVTDVSGRGVGMDVVLTNLKKLGGSIDIDSQIGKGTTFRIKLPLTLAIIPSLLVAVGDERYAIPQVNLVELVRIPAAQVASRIERIGTAMVMRQRGDLLPLLRLHDVLGLPTSEEPLAVEKALNIVVVSAGDMHYGLIVDHMLDSEEIVVKPLGQHLQGCRAYAGATIQGDGRVALILDVMGIRSMMHLTTMNEAVGGMERTAYTAKKEEAGHDRQILLIIRNGSEEQFALPLSLVSRIEKITPEAVEITGGQRHMQYRGGTLRLLAIEDVARVKPCEVGDNLAVIVFTAGGREIGLLVSEIVDVVEDEFTFDERTFRQPGILGSSIIMERTTLLIDLFGLVAAILPDWLVKTMADGDSHGTTRTTLVVDDSPFFRHHITSFIENAGYHVITANDGVEALHILQGQVDGIDLVVTDLEMPNLDGYGLTEHIRRDDRLAHLPVIMVTSVVGQVAEERARSIGVNDYLIKLDQENVLTSIARHIGQYQTAS